MVAALLASLVFADPAAAQSLKDLIPDSAVENPEAWAEQGAQGATVQSPEEEIPADEEIGAGLPDDGVARFEVEQPEPLETGEAVEFPDPEFASFESTAELQTFAISSILELGLPSDLEVFPEREDFIDRFRALSAVRALDAPEDHVAQLAVRAREDERLLRQILETYGYYDGVVVRIPSTSDGEAPTVRFDVQPGRQFLFDDIALGNLAATGDDYPKLRASFGIERGDPVLQDRILAERDNLGIALAESGYPFATISQPKLTVDHDIGEADLAMPVSPDGKYRFGSIISDQPKFLSSKHLETLARFEAGDLFQASRVVDLRRTILSTGLVSAVAITPREVSPPQGGQPGTVDLDVEMEQAPLRSIIASVAYGTGEGFQVTGSWEHRNLFPPEGMLRVRAIAGTREQLGGITFRRTNIGGRDKVLSFDLAAHNEDRDAYKARTITFLATYERKSTLIFQKRLSWGVGVEILASSEAEVKPDIQNPVRDTFFVGALPLNGQFDSTSDLLDPRKGFRVGLELSPEISLHEGNTSTYLKARIDASVYHPVGGVVLAARAALGTIVGAEFTEIAPSRRFYAGGGGSVRGYGYQAIGAFDETGDPNGGRSLAEFALEARIPTGLLGGAVSVVPFVDAGTVGPGTTPDFGQLQFGAGLGFRYKTSIGPIRLDIATPLKKRERDAPVAVYVSLGQAF